MAQKGAVKPDGRAPEGAERLRDHLRSVTLADVFDKRVLGFALILAWASVTFFSDAIHYSTRNDVTHFNSVVGFSSLGMVAVLLAGACGEKALTRFEEKRFAPWLAPLAIALATVVLVIVERGPIEQPWCSIASTVAGAGLGMFYLGWGNVFSRLTIVQVMTKTAASFVLSALIFAGVVLLPLPAAIAVTIALPLASAAILLPGLGGAGARSHGATAGEGPQLLPSAFPAVPLSLGLLAFAGAVVQALLLDASPIINNGSYPWLLLIAVLVSLVVLCVPMLSADSPDFAAAYRTAVLLFGFVFLLLPLLKRGTIAADGLGLTLYATMNMLTWIVLARLSALGRLSPLRTFGIGWAAQVAGFLGGSFLGALLASFSAMSPQLLSAMTLVCTCLLYISYRLLLGAPAQLAVLSGAPGSGRRPFREHCHRVAVDHGLTDREEEVMVLVAKGRSTPRIREALGLTAGTVNTHLSHVYRKLEVHDRQEVIDLVETYRGASPSIVADGGTQGCGVRTP